MFKSISKNQRKDKLMGNAHLDELKEWKGKTLLELVSEGKIINVTKAKLQFKDGREADFMKAETRKCFFYIGLSRHFDERNFENVEDFASCRFYITKTRDMNDPANIEDQYDTYTGKESISFGNPSVVNEISEEEIEAAKDKAEVTG